MQPFNVLVLDQIHRNDSYQVRERRDPVLSALVLMPVDHAVVST
jgi:hypothetical protein